MTKADIEYQVTRHAECLMRWLSEKEARAQARRRVLAGECWLWPKPPEPWQQLALF